MAYQPMFTVRRVMDSEDMEGPGALRWLTGTFLYLYVRCLYRTVAALLTLDFSRRISRENDFLFILFQSDLI